MSKDNGGPAFGELQQVGDVAMRDGGLSIRDYFAAKAMQGMIAAVGYHRDEVDFIAESAYDCADAMLKERCKS